MTAPLVGACDKTVTCVAEAGTNPDHRVKTLVKTWGAHVFAFGSKIHPTSDRDRRPQTGPLGNRALINTKWGVGFGSPISSLLERLRAIGAETRERSTQRPTQGTGNLDAGAGTAAGSRSGERVVPASVTVYSGVPEC